MPKNIIIVGVSGSGKSTLAKAIADRLNLRNIELDDLYWGANWIAKPLEDFRQLTAEATADPGWIANGNHQSVSDLTWPKAHLIIWLDYSLYRCLWRAFKRSLGDIRYQRRRCNGNSESFRRLLHPGKSILAWIVRSRAERRQRFLAAMQDPQWAHLKFVQLKNPQETKDWLARL